jgi:hypothetical protein
MSMSAYKGLNPFNFIRNHFQQNCIRKVAVQLQNLSEVMSTSIYIVLKPYRIVA